MSRLEWRLPMAVALLLLVVSSAMVAMTYAGSRREAAQSAGLRLRDLARQLTADLEGNTANLRRQALATASLPEVVAVLEGRASADVLRTRLAAGVTATSQTFALELWLASGASVLSMTAPAAPAVDPAWTGFPTWARASDVSMTVPLPGAPGGTFAIAAPVRVDGRLLGYVVTRRRVVSPSNSGQMVLNLIGPESRLLVGAPQSVWVDLTDVAAMPAEAVMLREAADVYWTTDVDGRWLGAMSKVSASGWHLRVEFPEHLVYEHSRSLLRNTIGIALLVTALGALGGWAVSRRLIGPLRTLTNAAVQISDGVAAPTLPRFQGDEIDALSDAFNTMARRVHEGRRDLEIRVLERTDALTSALARAEDYAQQLERSNRELEAFSYTISHDLRAPLRGIDGFSEALQTEYADRLDAQGLEYLMRVRRAAKRMDQLINDLLELAKVSRVERVTGPVALDRLATGAVMALRERDSKRSVEVVIPAGVSAQGDSRLLALVIQNLIENAWKFTSTRAHARIEFGVDSTHVPLAYFVRDNGVGFDMAHSGRLFGIFQRLHSPGDFPGTGVGLAIVQRAIERHGGRVWAESAPDAGATFFFTLEPDHA